MRVRRAYQAINALIRPPTSDDELPELFRGHLITDRLQPEWGTHQVSRYGEPGVSVSAPPMPSCVSAAPLSAGQPHPARRTLPAYPARAQPVLLQPRAEEAPSCRPCSAWAVPALELAEATGNLLRLKFSFEACCLPSSLVQTRRCPPCRRSGCVPPPPPPPTARGSYPEPAVGRVQGPPQPTVCAGAGLCALRSVWHAAVLGGGCRLQGSLHALLLLLRCDVPSAGPSLLAGCAAASCTPPSTCQHTASTPSCCPSQRDGAVARERHTLPPALALSPLLHTASLPPPPPPAGLCWSARATYRCTTRSPCTSSS